MNSVEELIRGLVRDVPDYPSPGILFKDITPLLANGAALAATVAHLADRATARKAWFASVAADWGRQNDTLVTVDTIPLDKIAATARAQIKAGKGHDIFIFGRMFASWSRQRPAP